MAKQLLVVGNWKSNKTASEAHEWMAEFVKQQVEIPDQNTVILCPPFHLLAPLATDIRTYGVNIKLAAQDVSPFGQGAYTGEVNAVQVADYVGWVLVGHSERRSNFGETDDMLFKKVGQAHGAGLQVIFCVPDERAALPAVPVAAVAYEPVWAIGSGKADTPEHAHAVITAIKQRTKSRVIYGGSVTADNVALFVSQPSIDGVLPGGASLDSVKFAALLKAAFLLVSS